VTVNLFAGMGAHQSAKSETDSWLTPPAIVEALGGASSFDLDPCAEAGSPIATALTTYTEAENGLLMPWFGRVWLNPPYRIALITKFLGRMAAHDRGTALMFARTETDPFHRFVWGAASGLLFLRGRLNFHRPDGTRAEANGGAPSVLIAYGQEDCEILSAAPIDGAFIALRLKTSMLVKAFEPGTTWAEALDAYMASQSGPVELNELYRAFVNHPKSRENQHWRDKLRQMLQRGAYERVAKGVWQRIEA
jgi:hypothetical protein